MNSKFVENNFSFFIFTFCIGNHMRAVDSVDCLFLENSQFALIIQAVVNIGQQKNFFYIILGGCIILAYVVSILPTHNMKTFHFE